MLKYCRKSCSVCECVDKNSLCALWKYGGKCTTNAEYMTRECPDSCGLCAHYFNITRLVLVNADTNKDVRVLKDGDVVPYTFHRFNIRAEVSHSDRVESVYLELVHPSSKKDSRTENYEPYAVFSDNNGNYNGKPVVAGRYFVRATPYSENSKKGTKGDSVQLYFSFVNV